MQISETKYILFDSTPCWVIRPVQARCAFRLYISHLDKYITPIGLLTEDELDYFYDMEQEWKESLEDYSWGDMAKLFLTTKTDKKHIARLLQAEIDLSKKDINKTNFFIDDLIYRKAKDEAQGREILNILYNTSEEERVIKRNAFRIATLQDRPVKNGITDEDISRAKQYPISEFLQFNKQGKTLCLWHTDKNPSLHYYKNSNTVYCFTCNRKADVVDVYQKLHNVNFIQAVTKLI